MLNMSGTPWKTDIQVSGLEVELKSQYYVGKYWGDNKTNVPFSVLGNDYVQEVDLPLPPQCMLIIFGVTLPGI